MNDPASASLRLQPGSQNQFLPGQRVRWRRDAKREFLRGYLEACSLPAEDGGLLLRRRALAHLQALIEAVIDNRVVKGTVRGYGQLEASVDPAAPADLRYVYVVLRLSPTVKYSAYFQESDFEAI